MHPSPWVLFMMQPLEARRLPTSGLCLSANNERCDVASP
jgi:hypothetical protein